MVFARTAAMGFNRLADRKLDAANPRTSGRHLPAGSLRPLEVGLLVAGSCLGFIATTLWFLPNRAPIVLSAPVLLFLLSYSFAKRFTALAHYWLGTALMLAPVCTWIAIRGEVLLSDPADMAPALVLGAAVLLWVGGFDVIYACQDVESDRRQGLFSLPARFGVPAALRLAAASHLGTVLFLAALPWAYPIPSLGGIYWTGVAGIALLLSYEHWLVRPDDLSRVNQAFFHVNAIISIGLLVAVAIDLWM
jgi:4-hydroxybenzoate polyprenyltransferase